MLSIESCYQRQQRLLQEMAAARTDLFLTSNFRTVYYLTGVLTAADTPTIFGLHPDGRSLLITASNQEQFAATNRLQVETYSIERTITEPLHDAVALLHGPLSAHAAQIRTCAVERAGSSAVLEDEVRRTLPHAALSDATRTILKLRKRKLDDEIAEIRQALDLSAVAYQAARDAIRPGISEIDVYNQMNAALTRAAGTVVAFPGDFACGERAIKGGGAPTARLVQEGDLYVLDLFPAPNVYSSDTCRTFAVSTPTDAQHKAWEAVTAAMRLGELLVKPGVRARDVYTQVKSYLDSQDPAASFWHHLGHGIGFPGHEAPRLIPGTDDVFEVGDVFTLEPALYGPRLQGGIRIEDNYVVRETTIENLFHFPREL
jgi:Xaa-Pro aminopeptidase